MELTNDIVTQVDVYKNHPTEEQKQQLQTLIQDYLKSREYYFSKKEIGRYLDGEIELHEMNNVESDEYETGYVIPTREYLHLIDIDPTHQQWIDDYRKNPDKVTLSVIVSCLYGFFRTWNLRVTNHELSRYINGEIRWEEMRDFYEELQQAKTEEERELITSHNY